MGQGLSCAASQEHGFFTSVQLGELDTVNAMLERDPSLLHQTTYDSQYPLHIAAANGQIEILTMLLERSVDPDMVNRHKQTPLMLAAMHGKISCLIKLIEAGAAYYGHSDCLQVILSAAQSSPVAVSWGFARFVNIRDG
ncbi:hypothetical protein OIU78_007916, partial [Salix suchowensis]